MGSCVSKPHPSNSSSLRPWCGPQQAAVCTGICHTDLTRGEYYRNNADSGSGEYASSSESDVAAISEGGLTAEEKVVRTELCQLGKSGAICTVVNSFDSTTVDIIDEPRIEPSSSTSDFARGPGWGQYGSDVADRKEDRCGTGADGCGIKFLTNLLKYEGVSIPARQSVMSHTESMLVSPILKIQPHPRGVGVDTACNLSDGALARTYSSDRPVSHRGNERSVHVSGVHVIGGGEKMLARIATAGFREGVGEIWVKGNEVLVSGDESGSVSENCADNGRVARCVRIYDGMVPAKDDPL